MPIVAVFAAILNGIGAGAHMCCGHKEYAPRRKTDPSFEMNHFRSQVAAIMADTAPRPGSTSAADANNRPTLRRGAQGPLVEELQRRLGVAVDGKFGPATESAVRRSSGSMGWIPTGSSVRAPGLRSSGAPG
jgi:hypothetical protein